MKTTLLRRFPEVILPLVVLLFAPLTAPAQPPATMDAAEIELALKRLTVAGSVLYVAAHPDDENTALLAYLANGRGVRTAYLSLTRGDGGQNLIGTEKGELLGIVRTQELLAARRIDGAEQFFTRALDFGFSKSPAETLAVWDREAVLGDVVWVIRNFRPDIIITRFPTTGEGGHGHHTASAILAGEAFEAAGDPSRFPEQLQHVRPWKPKRLLWNVFNFRPGVQPPPANANQKLVSVDVGAYNALLGKSYTEIAAASRSMHKSQGFGAAERRGPSPNQLSHLAGEAPTTDLFDGVDLSWRRYSGGAAVEQTLKQAAREFKASEPHLILPLLVRAHREMRTLLPADDPLVQARRRELLDVIRACAGLWLEAIAANPYATPRESVRITATLVNRSDFPLRLESIHLPYGNAVETVNLPLKNNEPVQRNISPRLNNDAEPSQPYWLTQRPAKGVFKIASQAQVGRAENAPALPVTFRIIAGGAGEEGEPLMFEVPTQYRWTDRVRGEIYRPFEIVPPVVVNLDERTLIFPDARPRQVRATLHSYFAEPLSGTLRLRLPAGWRATPESVPVTLKQRDEEQAATFTLTPPAGAGTPVGTFAAEVELAGWETQSRGLLEIDYPHIPVQTLYPPAEGRLVRVELQKRGERVGYIMGSGDEVPEALRQVGYTVTLLSDEDLANADLQKFDAIIAGVRAYNTRARLRAQQKRLLEYVERGGTFIVQYNTPDASLADFPLGPYPFKISQDRVTVEEAPVQMLAPQDALLNAPNKITAADFEGWVQERGLYFPNQWDEKYSALFASHDPGETDKRGGTLVARYGRGTYIYTAYAWFRQLPAGVPGAYRLFVNMISAGKQ